MRVLIGLKDSAGQPILDVDQSEEELLSAWTSARENDSYLDLTDKKGKRAIVAANSIAYIMFEDKEDRRVGFGRV